MEAVKQKISTKSLAFGEHVNQKLLTYSQYVRNQVEYKISAILYEADMGYYDERSRSSVSGKQYSSSPSVSSSYRQRVYSPAPSPLSYHAIPTPSPTSVYEASNSSDSYTTNALNTQSQYSPISTYAASPAIPTPSPTPVNQASNLSDSNATNTLNTQSQCQYSSVSTYASSPITHHPNSPAAVIEYTEAIHSDFIGNFELQQDNVLMVRTVRNSEGNTTAVEYITTD